jgi:methionine sulfoxide reductase catalytic subunit
MHRRYLFPHIASSEITAESVYLKRRDFMRAGGLAALPVLGGVSFAATAAEATAGSPLHYSSPSSAANGFRTDEQQTPVTDIMSYGNYFEFGTDKSDPGQYAHEMSIDPWSIEVDGAVNKPGKLNLEDILSSFNLEERIYRLRCVEAWSMVVPWVGFPLADLLARFEPTTEARYLSRQPKPATWRSRRCTGPRKCAVPVHLPVP